MNGWIEPLLEAAARAPSGDNTQPWRFVVDGETVSLALDPARDPSPMNAGQRMSRIAVGAALENLLIAAGSFGLSAELAGDPAPHLARVRFRGEVDASAVLAPQLGARATNRRAYDGRALAPDLPGRLAAGTPERDGVATHWVVGADRLKAVAATIGRADGLMFGDPRMRRAFLGNVRFDRPPGEAVDEGLSLGSLELTAADRVALRVMRRVPDTVLKLAGASSVFSGKARQLVVSASGLLVVTAPDGAEATDVNVGRSVQRAWLALTASGLAAQPMMSIPVLANALDHGDDRLKAALGVARVSALLDEFHSLVPEAGMHRPAWLMRFGYAPPPSGRTGRLPLAAVTSYDRTLSPRPGAEARAAPIFGSRALRSSVSPGPMRSERPDRSLGTRPRPAEKSPATAAMEIEHDRVMSFLIAPGTLERFCEALGDGGPRIKCHQGSMTLVSPGRTHETSDRRVLLLILAICEALKIPILPLGATLFHIPGDTGYEPDESYYLQSHGTAAPGQVPDLAVEVVVTNPETKALACGALLCIPELWVWDIPRHQLTFHHLVRKGRGGGVYRPQDRSLALPFLTPAVVLERLGTPVDAATFDAGAFSSRNRAWARRVLLPLHRASGGHT